MAYADWTTGFPERWTNSFSLDTRETSDKQHLTMRTKKAESARRGKLVLASAVAAALLIRSLVGCRSTDASPPTRNVLAATLAGYHIQASSDRPATIESRGDHVLITFAHHQLRVEKGRVVLDDNETAAFPITATRITIEVAGGTLRMTTDGQEMWKKPFPNA